MTIAATSKDDQLLAARLRDYYANLPEDEVRQDLQTKYGAVWNAEELLSEFAVSIFDELVLRVIRKSDGIRGTVAYVDAPRLYFAFEPETAAISAET
jgi:hypothetical protein